MENKPLRVYLPASPKVIYRFKRYSALYYMGNPTTAQQRWLNKSSSEKTIAKYQKALETAKRLVWEAIEDQLGDFAKVHLNHVDDKQVVTFGWRSDARFSYTPSISYKKNLKMLSMSGPSKAFDNLLVYFDMPELTEENLTEYD